jgi:hypothetical protein
MSQNRQNQGILEYFLEYFKDAIGHDFSIMPRGFWLGGETL